MGYNGKNFFHCSQFCVEVSPKFLIHFMLKLDNELSNPFLLVFTMFLLLV